MPRAFVAGPFPVQGEQVQRGVAKHAFHQIHSMRGKCAEPRSFSSCCVCARGCWKEDLRSLKLFVTAAKTVDVEEVVEEELEEAVEEEETLEESPVSLKTGKSKKLAISQSFHAPSGPSQTGASTS